MTMQRKDKQALQGFRLVAEFLVRHDVENPVGSIATQRGALAAVVEQMTALAAERERGADAALVATREIVSARRRLEAHFFAPVRRLAGRVPSSDGLQPVGRVARMGTVVSQLAVARALVQAARAHGAAFVAAGLSADYADQLEGQANALEAALARRGRLRAEVSGAVKGLKELGTRGRGVLAVVEALVKPVLLNSPSLWREWQSVRRRAVWTPSVQAEALEPVGELKAA